METTTAYPLRILLADDDEDDRTFFREALQELGFPFVLETAGNGFELLKSLTVQDSILPHLIFLDLNMPGKSGKECLLEIRALSRLSQIPIIIFSTSSSLYDIDDTFRNGANLYIQKPSGFGLMVILLAKVFSINWNEHLAQMERKRFILHPDQL